jgi:hypothetical protein
MVFRLNVYNVACRLKTGRPLLDNGSVVTVLHRCLGDKHVHATTHIVTKGLKATTCV